MAQHRNWHVIVHLHLFTIEVEHIFETESAAIAEAALIGTTGVWQTMPPSPHLNRRFYTVHNIQFVEIIWK